MNQIDERELRQLLRDRPPANVMIATVVAKLLDDQLPWPEKRPYWHYLHQTGRASTVSATLVECLNAKMRVPFDVLLTLAGAVGITPSKLVRQAFVKGLRKQHATEEVLAARRWDEIEPKIPEMRARLFEHRRELQREYQASLGEKFEFLRGQRMFDQAGRVLKRMIELYPDDESYLALRDRFQEERAREVLANRRVRAKFEQTETAPSTSDAEMLKCFVEEGVKMLVDKREIAPDLAIALWFLDDFAGAREVLAWAAPAAPVDWMHAEVLFAGRRFLECFEFINHLEIKYVSDPETTFAASYLRAQCLKELGQHAGALETMRSIAHIRPNYRSAHQLLLEWAEGVDWE